MKQTIPPIIRPYMWESERFKEKFTNLFLNLLKNINTEDNSNHSQIKLLKKMLINSTYDLSDYSTFYKTMEDPVDPFGIQKYKLAKIEYKDMIIKYIKETAPEEIWLLFKLREE